MSERVVKVNPFESIKLVSINGRKGKAVTRRYWTDIELRELLRGLDHIITTGAPGASPTMASRLKSLVLIAIYSGMRLDEICSLRVEDVRWDGDCTGGLFIIREGKTEASVRELPVHPRVRPLVEQLVSTTPDGYLISGLTCEGPDGKRSWHVSKAFGRLKARLGFPRSLVFHSFRHVYSTKLEQAGVDPLMAARLMGHRLPGMTFGHYSHGQLLEAMLEACSRVSYEL